MPLIQRNPLWVILLAATILTLMATSSLFAADDVTEYQVIRKQAEAGDSRAQFYIGVMYSVGIVVSQDHAEAVKWWRKAAEQGNIKAQAGLMDSYNAGQGVPQDYEEAAKWSRKAAEQGDISCQVMLANYYRLGRGVPEDNAEAFKWFRKAAEQRDEEVQVAYGVKYRAEAQMEIGHMYGSGRGVKQDDAEAVKWLRKAAEQGQVDAMRILGFGYLFGLGSPKDYVQSYFWYSLASSRASGDDYKEVSGGRDNAAKKLTPDQLREAQRMTREWEKAHPRK